MIGGRQLYRIQIDVSEKTTTTSMRLGSETQAHMHYPDSGTDSLMSAFWNFLCKHNLGSAANP